MTTLTRKAVGVLSAATLLVGMGAATAEAKSTKSALKDASKACEKAGGEFFTGSILGFDGFGCGPLSKNISSHDLTQIARDCGVVAPHGNSILFVYLSHSDGGPFSGFLCGNGSLSDLPPLEI